jgi:hypothetical protein
MDASLHRSLGFEGYKNEVVRERNAMTFARRHIALAGAAAALLGPGLARAQSGEEARVAQAVEALTKAMIAVDRQQLDALTSEHLSYGHSAGRIETKKQFIDYPEGRQSAFRRIDLTEQTIGIAGDEAVVRHLLTGETISPAGQVTPVRIGVLQVWTKEGANWKLLARQAYRL